MIRAPAGQIRIESVSHHGDGITFSAVHGELGDHRLCLGQLVFSAVGHQHGSGSDGGVEHLDQSLLGAAVQILQPAGPAVIDPVLFKRLLLKVPVLMRRHLYLDIRLLVGSVGIEERSADINDRMSAPVHDKAPG